MSVATQAPEKPKPTPILFHRRRGMVVVLLCVMYFISYFDRTNIATAGPSIQASVAKGGLGLTPFEFGLATSVFAIGYAVFQILGGRIGERLGPRRALLILGALWGAATIASGLAGGLISLLIARGILGLSESATFPTATQAMSRWVPRDRNGLVQGIVHSASRLGTAAAPIVVAAIIAASGWRESFIYVGILSVIWAIVWFILFRDQPKQMKNISQQELSEIPEIAKPADTPPVPWRRLSRSILPVTAVDFGYGWVAWVFFTWIPSLLASVYNQDVAHYGLLTSFILVGGVVGDTLGGVLSDARLRRTGNARNARRLFLLIGFIGAAVFMVPILFTPPLVVAVVSLALAFFFLELTNAQLWSIPMDVAPTWSGAASGMMNSGFAVAGVLSALIGGALIQWTSGFGWIFAVSIAILIGAIVIAAVMHPKVVDPLVDDSADGAATAAPSAAG
jgi:MFS family permease